MSFLAGRTIDRRDVATLPNLVTFVRLLVIPVFIWLLFAREERGAAAWTLGALGSTDWVDGWLARKLGQVSEFGKIFDPVVDRLLFLVAIPALMIDGSVPLIVAVLALAREGLVAVAALILAAAGVERFDVTRAGKTGAFLLMFAFPLFLGANSELSYAVILGPLAWIFGVPGLVFSYYSLLFEYVPMTRRGLAARS
jgi:cardiolipin synthase